MKSKQKRKVPLRWPLIIKTKRLILRPYEPSDYKAWVDAFLTRGSAKNSFDDGPKKSSQLKRSIFNKMLVRHRKCAVKDIAYVWAIFEKKTGKLLGWVDLYIFSRDATQSANFGYCLHNQYWGRGFGQEAAGAMARAAIKDLKLHRLEATINPKNRSSIKLIRSIGFRREGLRRSSDWHKEQWCDEIVYSAIPRDFNLPNKAPEVTR